MYLTAASLVADVHENIKRLKGHVLQIFVPVLIHIGK
jgi:hypothetical protein